MYHITKFLSRCELQDKTKQEILTYGTMEIPLIRSGCRLLMGITPPKESFAKAGLDMSVCNKMFDIVNDYSKISPDSYESALLTALAATSPDRGIASAVDYKILSNIQVSTFNYN